MSKQLSAVVLGVVFAVLLACLVDARVKDAPSQNQVQESDEAALSELRKIIGEEEYILRYLSQVSPQDEAIDEISAQKRRISSRRSCIRRQDSCDGRLNDCCSSLACRCNLWGTNCRCQRVGILQRLGK